MINGGHTEYDYFKLKSDNNLKKIMVISLYRVRFFFKLEAVIFEFYFVVI